MEVNNEGGWTYIGGSGVSVIDYVVANEKAEEMIRKVVERERIESDHVPLEVELEAQMEETKNKKKVLKR